MSSKDRKKKWDERQTERREKAPRQSFLELVSYEDASEENNICALLFPRSMLLCTLEDKIA